MQVVTVVVRALATPDLAPDNVHRVIRKELAVGVLNGIVFASILGTISGIWFGDARIGVVLAAAMIFNMVWAGLAGSLIPIAIQRMKIDPAVGAGPFLTTTTDVLGFFSFLGLASLFLL
jgi:magnesium transporter